MDEKEERNEIEKAMTSKSVSWDVLRCFRIHFDLLSFLIYFFFFWQVWKKGLIFVSKKNKKNKLHLRRKAILMRSLRFKVLNEFFNENLLLFFIFFELVFFEFRCNQWLILCLFFFCVLTKRIFWIIIRKFF